MPRTIISLNDAEKAWLARQAEKEQVSMTEIVRRALELYRRGAAAPEPAFDALLDRTRGIWRQGDGLAYQEGIRGEWDRR
jgi:hypothetical protein